jgi:phosphoenolpyruvate synthase/pyruvate phosphate dikinase
VFNVTGRIQTQDDVTIRPDLAKLDLARMDFISLGELRATDSGRLCGPKGANLGELKFLFGERVPNGFVIPFGVFRAVLDRPIEPGGPSVFEWMKDEYRTIADLAEYPGAQGEHMRSFLAKLRSWISSTDPGDDFRARLRGALNGTFGSGEGYGVFVRSDTNVEDLPGFTGAGLNLTVPNVVGFDNIVTAVQQVWSSPFTERSYSWRQSHMEQPEYVFPSVVVQLSFPSEKSGVMVTADLEARQPGWISIAVSEGVGGAVDGQAAEALRVNYASAESRQLARATSPYRREVAADGGVNEVRASGVDSVLREAEIVQLLALARDVDTRFPGLQRADGSRAPADVEFAFRKSQLALLQIRPFVESKRAREDFYLAALDVGIRDFAAQPVDLDGIPGGQ